MCFIVTSVKKLKLAEFWGKEGTQATISWELKRCKQFGFFGVIWQWSHHSVHCQFYSHSNNNLYNFINFLPYVDRFDIRIQPIEGIWPPRP